LQLRWIVIFCHNAIHISVFVGSIMFESFGRCESQSVAVEPTLFLFQQ